MHKKEFFSYLGFSDYESDALIALTNLKIASPKEISNHSGVPQNKLYQILSKFEVLGILARIPSDTKKYKLINFRSYINELINAKEKSLEELKDGVNNLDLVSEGDESVFSLIKGQTATIHKIAEHNLGVKKEVLGVQRNWKIWGEGLRVMEDLIKRGVSVKLIGVVNDKTRSRALEWKNIGCKIKVYDEKFGPNPLRFSIFDSEDARITIGKPEISDPKDYITIWTKSKPLINVLKAQFFNMWSECENF